MTLVACDQQQAATDSLAQVDSGAPDVAVSGLFPGGGAMPPEDARGKSVDGNPEAINEGRRLFEWYNCAGCHSHGAGGIGPPLLDHAWRYGSRIDQIFSTIYHGRPNGMPSWAGKIPQDEIWNIAAYVRSLATTESAKPVPTEKPLPVTLPPTNPEPEGQEPKPPPKP